MSKNTGTSELINYFTLGASGAVDIGGNLTLSTIANATTDTDKFLVSDTGIIKYRTGAELLTDIGAAPAVAGGYVPYTGAGANVDLGVYDLTANAVNVNGSGSNAGVINLESNTFFSLVNGYGTIGSGTTNQFNLYQTTGAGVFRGAILSLNSITASATRTFTLPDADGTLALTSSLGSYLPLAGGTLTGPLGGTSATFISSNAAGTLGVYASASGRGVMINPNLTVGQTSIYSDYLGGAEPTLYLSTYSNRSNGLGITLNTNGTITFGGAATFSSNVTLTSGYLSVDGFGNAATNYITMRSGFVPNSSGGIGLMAIDHSGSSNDGLACYGHDGVSLYTAQTERMRITSGGNVGIGTDTPINRLHIATVTNADISIRLSDQDDNEAFGIVPEPNSGNGKLYFMARSGYNTAFNSATDAKITMQTNGNVGIGTASPKTAASGSSRTLDVKGGIYFGNTGAESCCINNDDSFILNLDANNDGGTFNYFRIAKGTTGETGGTELFRISGAGVVTVSALGTGTVTATSGVLSAVSDMNLKIEDGFIDNALEKVLNLKPRYFYWNEESGLPTDIRQLGFYAQEVNEVLGEEVANSPKTENENWGIYDRGIIAMLTKAIQEQQVQIQELKNKLS